MARIVTWVTEPDGTQRRVIREEAPEDEIPPQITDADKEEEVQRIAEELVQNNERDKAIALATVDLALAVRDGTADGLTTAQVRSLFRDRVVFYLRQERGL